MLRGMSIKLEFKTAVKFSDIIIAVVGAAFLIATYVQEMPLNLPHLSTIILGLAIISGILTAFAGFWLAYIYIDSEQSIKKWMKKRLIAIALLIFLVGASAIGGVSHLVNGNLQSAYRYTIIGTLTILFTLLDTLFFIVLHGFSEKALVEKETEDKRL